MKLKEFWAHNIREATHLHLIREFGRLAAKTIPDPLPAEFHILDCGCSDGKSTLEYFKSRPEVKSNHLTGIEGFSDLAQRCSEKFETVTLNIENQVFPFPNDYFDVSLCNQVFEHLKEIFLPITELHRTLKPGGTLIWSVPNGSAWHNRLLLLAGQQPSCVRTFGPHVRIFTPKSARQFLTYNQHFQQLYEFASGFYPFPPGFLSALMAKTFPGMAVYSIFILQKKTVPNNLPNWLDWVRESHMETLY
jgi:SAM-dependent methyltransferase